MENVVKIWVTKCEQILYSVREVPKKMKLEMAGLLLRNFAHI